MTIWAFTSFSFSYLDRAELLLASLRKWVPDWQVCAVVTDTPPPGFSFGAESHGFDRLIWSPDLFGDDAQSWLFAHDIVEACTAVKGRALKLLLEEEACSGVVYFDPDIVVFGNLGDLEHRLQSASVVLTPHQIDYEDDSQSILNHEMASLRHGVFNLGFVAVRDCDEGRRFANWWDARLSNWCHDRLDYGLFVDQKWCNLVPCLFDDVQILRDPGYNVAWWNLNTRRLVLDGDGTAWANGRPLRFFHFSGTGSAGRSTTQRLALENFEIQEFWNWYERNLKSVRRAEIPDGWWGYANFDNGVPISRPMREYYRYQTNMSDRFKTPFETGAGSYFEWISQNTRFLSASSTN